MDKQWFPCFQGRNYLSNLFDVNLVSSYRLPIWAYPYCKLIVYLFHNIVVISIVLHDFHIHYSVIILIYLFLSGQAFVQIDANRSHDDFMALLYNPFPHNCEVNPSFNCGFPTWSVCGAELWYLFGARLSTLLNTRPICQRFGIPLGSCDGAVMSSEIRNLYNAPERYFALLHYYNAKMPAWRCQSLCMRIQIVSSRG